MILISHRGNITGPNPERENDPSYVKEALNKGYDCEIDIWWLGIASGWWLGHDKPQYNIHEEYLNNERLWCHCKNIDALNEFNTNTVHLLDCQFFWHQNDDYTLTSKKYIWTYPGKELGKYLNSIAVLPEKFPDWNIKSAIGICSDYIEKYKEL